VIEMAKSKIIALVLATGLTAGCLLLSGCTTASTADGTGGFNWTAVIMAVVLFALVYFFIFRPMRKRQKEQQNMIAELKGGDQVITAGGIYGEVDSIDQESLVIKVESGAKIRVLKQGILVKRSPKK
jgi:preprotein translocase subunit YajC